MRDLLSDYWVQFAATGDPNRSGLPAWPAYSEAEDACLVIEDGPLVTENLRKAQLDAIDQFMARWRNEAQKQELPKDEPTIAK